MLLTVIAGISLGAAATALPGLIRGPFLEWLYLAKVLLWCTGVLAGVLEYLAVSFGSRLYLTRVEVFATTSLALVFLSQAGLFVVLTMDGNDLLVPRWFSMFAVFSVIAAVEAHHGRRMVRRYGESRFPAAVVTWYARSLGQVVLLLAGSVVVSLVIALTGRGAPGWLVLLFACVALGTVVAANVHQEHSRNTLATHGVVPAA